MLYIATHYELLSIAALRQVHMALGSGRCLAIFPEGGSHDQTHLLPLKAGVALMGLGKPQLRAHTFMQHHPLSLSGLANTEDRQTDRPSAWTCWIPTRTDSADGTGAV